MKLTNPTCVMCGQPAITAAAHIPVCQIHWDEYDKEAKQYLELEHRPVFRALLAASAALPNNSPKPSPNTAPPP